MDYRVCSLRSNHSSRQNSEYTVVVQDEITLHAEWLIKAPLSDVYKIMTDFEHWPEYFPKVAASLQVVKRDGDQLDLAATVKSFGQEFPVQMKTQILPGEGFTSDNQSPKFGTSGHEELLLSENSEGTLVKYTYQVTIHKRWLRIVAKPLIGWFSMKYWKRAVIDELRKRVEK